MATKKAAIKSVHPKKEFKKELTTKLEPVLTELKNMLSEEDFQNRLKKAAKVLTQGLHSKDFTFSENNSKQNGNIKAVAKKVKGLKKAKAKNNP